MILFSQLGLKIFLHYFDYFKEIARYFKGSKTSIKIAQT